MQLTRFTDLSLRVLMYLAWQPENSTGNAAAIARIYRVPENHMVKVVHHLGKIGLIVTTRGRNGGIRLARPASEIRIGDVVRLTESSFDLVDCELPIECPLKPACRLKGVLDEAMDGFLSHLNRYTLADVAKGEFGRRTLEAAAINSKSIALLP